MVLDEKLSFTSHIGDKITKAKKELGVMKHIKKWVPFFYPCYILQNVDKTSSGIC